MKSFLFKVIIFLCAFHNAHAFSVSPMTSNFKTTGKESSVVYTISNPSDKPLAIEVKIESRTTKPDGTEVNDNSAEIKSHFSIFPAATLIAPKSKKGIRVVYVGPKDLKEEKAYRIIIVENPDTSSNQSVKMVREFRTSAFVAQEGSKAQLTLKGLQSNSDVIKLIFNNSGTAHQLVKAIRIKLSDELGNTVFLTEKSHAVLMANFLANEERNIEIKKPLELRGKKINGTIESVE